MNKQEEIGMLYHFNLFFMLNKYEFKIKVNKFISILANFQFLKLKS